MPTSRQPYQLHKHKESFEALRRIRLTLLATACIALAACAGEDSESPIAAAAPAAISKPAGSGTQQEDVAKFGIAPRYSGELNSLSLVNVRDAILRQVLPPMDYPWAFEFINDDEILLTRIAGQLLRINLATGESTDITGLPDIGEGYTQIGLLDIELHPDFANNQRIYFSYAKPNPQSSNYHLTEVATGVLVGGEIRELKTLVNSEDYGWPTISYGKNYSTTKPIGEGTHKEGLEQPVFYFLPSIAVSPLTVYRGDMFAEWDGDILVGALKGEHIAKLDFDRDTVRSMQAILAEVGGRIRDIKVAADGSIYILSQTSGLHRLYREAEPAPGATAAAVSGEPKAAAPAQKPDVHPGKKYYDLVCSGCHNTGISGAPVLGNYEQWQPILEQPMAVTRERVMQGYNAMPERGLCYTCSDSGLMQMVDYMFNEARAAAD